MAIVGCVFILTMVILTVFTDFSYELSVMPFAKIISYTAAAIAFLLCTLSFFFFEKHLFYYSALEILVFSNIYNGRIYTGLFLTAILFILLLLENRLTSKPNLIIYLVLEIIKLLLVIPYGVRSFLEYLEKVAPSVPPLILANFGSMPCFLKAAVAFSTGRGSFSTYGFIFSYCS